MQQLELGCKGGGGGGGGGHFPASLFLKQLSSSMQNVQKHVASYPKIPGNKVLPFHSTSA